jgi:phosphatidate cytidylyltransferase
MAKGAGRESTLTGRRGALVAVALGVVAWLLGRAPPLVVVGAIVAVATLAGHELHRLLDPAATHGHGLPIAAGAAVTAGFAAGDPWLILGVLALASLVLCLATLGGGALPENAAQAGTHGLFGVLYVALPLGFLILVRQGAHGRLDLALVVALTWSRDIGAALVGSSIDGRPRWPRLSPNKHGVGAAGGAAAVAAAAAATNAAGLASLSARDVTVLVILVSVLGQAGDLFASLLKRSAGVRHSGALFGEQGGVLDCVDGLLFVAPATWCYLQTLPHRSF